MQTNIKVSIVTTSYNSEATIAQTITSVLNQTYGNVEYFIIDGGSKDKSVEIAESFRDAFREKGYTYTIISERDKGIYDAMNKGIRMSTGEIVGMINSDDWYEPIAIETVVKTYQEKPFDMMYADLRYIKNEQPAFVKHSKLRKYVTTRDWNHPTTFVARHIYETYQFPLESVYDDLDFLLYMRSSNKNIVVVNETLANYRLGGASNQKTWEKTKERMTVKYRLYRRYHFSRLYWLEAVGMELAKFILA